MVFYLPAGYGPAQKLRFPTLIPGETASIEIGPGGAVAPFTAGGVALTQTSILPLDGIVFRP